MIFVKKEFWIYFVSVKLQRTNTIKNVKAKLFIDLIFDLDKDIYLYIVIDVFINQIVWNYKIFIEIIINFIINFYFWMKIQYKINHVLNQSIIQFYLIKFYKIQNENYKY